jgi:hypothetical protein
MTPNDELDVRMANLERYTRQGLYELAYDMRDVIHLYRTQIAYLLAELHRHGWTAYPSEAPQ